MPHDTEMTEEEHCLFMLHILRREYERNSKVYLDKLDAMHSKSKRDLYLTHEEMQVRLR